MSLGGSLALIAIGAILKFAVHTSNSHGFDVNTAGLILMIIGAIGLVISIIYMTARRRTDVLHVQDPAGNSRTTYLS